MIVKHRNARGQPHHFISIDPGLKNFALRVETRQEQRVIPLVFYVGSIPMSPSERIAWLDDYASFFSQADVVLIERQMKINSGSSELFSLLVTYFLIRYPQLGVWEVSPKLKGKLFNLPKGASSYQRKRISVIVAQEILKEGDDTISLEVIARTTKKDDLADTVCQIEAVCRFELGIF